MIELRGATVRVGRAELIRDVDLTLAAGSWTAIVGPNGAGKSTLLRAIAGTAELSAGSAMIGGRDGADLRPRERARLVAAVVQDPLIPVGMRVFDYVLLGRTPYISVVGSESPHDCTVAVHALEQLSLTSLAERPLGTLSGGERQRVLVARALAQEAPVLLLDEPTAALDIGHAQEVLELIDELRLARGLTVVSALHDLTLAAQFAERIVMMAAGSIRAVGPPAVLFTESLIGEVFGADVNVVKGGDGGLAITPVRTPKSERARRPH